MTNILLGNNTFGLTVYPNVDYAFVVAIIVIFDVIHCDRSRGTKVRVNLDYFNFDATNA
jgi:LURP-one-related